MRKFVLSLITFVSGLLGVVFCLSFGSIVESVYITSGVSDSLETYTYVLSPSAVLGLLLFSIIAIIGLILSIYYSKEIER